MQSNIILAPHYKGIVQAVLFPKQVLELMLRYRQTSFFSPEAGGMIIGRIRGEYLDVESITQPAGQDLQSRSRFVRRDHSHHQIAIDAWERSGREVGYLGEWHTHPEDNPTPSSIDYSAWKKIINNEHSPYCLFAIVGLKSLYFCVGHKDESESVVFHTLDGHDSINNLVN